MAYRPADLRHKSEIAVDYSESFLSNRASQQCHYDILDMVRLLIRGSVAKKVGLSGST